MSRSTAVEPQVTKLAYTARATVGGKMAQIGSRLIDATAAKIAEDFFRAFEATLQARAPAATRRGRRAGRRRAARARAGGNDRLGAGGDRRRRHALPDPALTAAASAFICCGRKVASCGNA